jgi:osmotically-inducible protein OsmY
MRKSLFAVLLALAALGVYAAAQSSSAPSRQPATQDHERSASQQPASQAPSSEAQEEQEEKGEHHKHAKNKEEKGEKHEAKGERGEKENLEHQVQRQLSSDPALSNVRAEVRGKEIVVLTGTVPTKKDRKHAEQLAESVPGVRKVKDRTKIGGPAVSAGTTPVGSAPGTSASSIESTTNTAGSIAGNTQAQPGASPTAGTSEAQIQNIIQNQITNSNVTVNQVNNNIVLVGSVPNEEAKERAIEIARRHAPGKQIVDRLTVGSASAASATSQTGASQSSTANGDIQSQIQQALRNEPALSPTVASNISVNVIGNNLVLSGVVPSEADKEKVHQVAQQKAGGMQIVNNVQVSSSAPSASSSNMSTAASGSNPPSTSAQTGAAVSGGPAGSTQPSAGAGHEAGAPIGGMTTAQSANDLKSQIENSLQREQLTGVIVNVGDTVVELTGTVQNGRQKETARRIAQSYAANRRVVDHIKLMGHGQGEINPSSENRPINGNPPGMNSDSGNSNNPPNPSTNPTAPHR